MEELLFPTKDISEQNVQSITEIYKELKTKHQVEFDFNFTVDLRQFELFRPDEIDHFGPVIKLFDEQKTFYLVFVEVSYKIGTGARYSSYEGREYQTWGVMNLRNKYGHVLIKPETILDKIHDLINPIDLDFADDKDFSRHFYVVTNDALKANSLLSVSCRNCVMNTRSMELIIEVIDNQLIIGNKKIIQTGSAIDLVNFMSSLSNSI